MKKRVAIVVLAMMLLGGLAAGCENAPGQKAEQAPKAKKAPIGC